MEIKSDNPDHGFQFPGTFELSAMGAAEKDLETVLPTLLLDAGIEVVQRIGQLEALEQRPFRLGADQLPRREPRAVRPGAFGAAGASGSEVDAVAVVDAASADTHPLPGPPLEGEGAMSPARVRDLGRQAYEPVWRAMQAFTDERYGRHARRAVAGRARSGVHPRPGRQGRARAVRRRHPGAARRSRRPGDLPRPRPDRRFTRCST